MDWTIAALLFGAGILGGIISAIAGGASLITFPAMLAAGLPPIVANASNSIAAIPGSLVAAVSDRSSLPAFDKKLIAALSVTIVGGGLGCILLLATSERAFTMMVPLLIGFATCVFAFGKQAQAAMARLDRHGSTGRSLLLLPAAIYGGYFGAGLGVVLLALLAVTGREDIRAANALKNLLGTAVSLVALAIFAGQNIVNWPAALTMFSGSVIGGAIGGRLVAVLPAASVRAAGITAGVAMTVVYGWRYWL
jgi:uncharacterized protein